jgi:hypothetical protein
MLRHDEDHAVHLQLIVKHLEDMAVRTNELQNSFQVPRNVVGGVGVDVVSCVCCLL